MVDRVRHYQFIPIEGGFPLNDALEQISRDLDEVYSLVAQATRALYGGMYMAAASVGGPDIDPIYQTITQFDTEAPPSGGVGVAVNTTTGEFTVLPGNVYLVSVSITLEHNEVNAGRETNLRVYNVTTGAPIPSTSVPIFVGRNQGGFNFGVTFMFEAPQANTPTVARLEIGGGDIFTLVTWRGLDLSLRAISSIGGI